MVKYRKVTIEWSYPVEINNILTKESMNDIGIYYISRLFGEKQSILYIGKTTYDFRSRLESHIKYWLNTYRGEKLVRLGRIVSPINISQEETIFESKNKYAEFENIFYRGDIYVINSTRTKA